MPRIGDVYSTPGGTDAVPGQTISSTAYNINVHDVESALNGVFPVSIGGTGSNTAAGALTALGALPLTGGTLTGSLGINNVVPGISINTTGAAGAGALNQIDGQKNGVRRWIIQLGDGVAETGGNAGSNFYIYGYDDGGTGWPFVNVVRSTRQVTQYLKTNFSNATGASAYNAAAVTLAGGLGVAANIVAGTTMSTGSVSFTLPAVSCGIAVAYAGGGTAYGMAFRPQADTTNALYFYNASGGVVGSISQTTSNVTYNTSSDARLKEDMLPFDAGPIIDQTNVYDFAWKVSGERSHGVLAQEAIEVFPEAVTHNEKDDSWGTDYSKYIPVLLQELKDLRARVAKLESKP